MLQQSSSVCEFWLLLNGNITYYHSDMTQSLMQAVVSGYVATVSDPILQTA